MKPLVHIIEDDEAVRRSLRRLLESIRTDSIGYATGRSFVEGKHALRPGCVLLDLRLPDMSGLELQRRMVPALSHLPVIFMSGYGDVETSVSAMSGGAATFLTKPVDPETLLANVRSANARSRTLLAQRQHWESVCSRVALLTPRESDVLKAVVAGCSNKQAARELGISPKTVELHRASVMRKMRAGSLAELVRLHLIATTEVHTASNDRGVSPS